MSSEKNHNLYTTFWQHASVDPQSPLLGTGGGNVYTYADAEELSSQLANYLTDLGLSAGDRVTTQVEKSPEALWLYLACLKAGLVFHPLNTAYQASELEYFLNDARSAVVVCDSRNEALMASLVSKENAPVIRTLNADGSGTLTDDSLDCEKQFTPVTSAADDLAALLYSSGTTGRPKGIMLSHANLAQNTLALCSAWEFNANDRLLHALPIFHVHGLFVGIGCVLMSGASMHWLPRFDIDDVLRFLPQCSVMMGVPTYYSRLLARSDFGREPCARMRLFISGSAPLPEATFHEFQQRTGHTILERYGMTETGMNTSNPLQGERKAGTVGKALPGVTVRVVDNAGNELPRGEPGNVQVKGANVFKGYWQMPEKTAGDFPPTVFLIPVIKAYLIVMATCLLLVAQKT